MKTEDGPEKKESSIVSNEEIDYSTLSIVDSTVYIGFYSHVQNLVPLVYFSRMDPIEMEKEINQMQQVPISFLQVNLPLLTIPRLDTHISTLFARLDILQDQDLVNMVIALILNPRTNHPDTMKRELQMFLGSQTRVSIFVDTYL